MKVRCNTLIKTLVLFISAILTYHVSLGQNQPTITNAFDSLLVENVAAKGNLKTGIVTITLNYRNLYTKLADVSLSLGGFQGLGITDDKGRKYKIYTSTQLIGTQDINKGYLKISAVQFGKQKLIGLP